MVIVIKVMVRITKVIVTIPRHNDGNYRSNGGNSEDFGIFHTCGVQDRNSFLLQIK